MIGTEIDAIYRKPDQPPVLCTIVQFAIVPYREYWTMWPEAREGITEPVLMAVAVRVKDGVPFSGEARLFEVVDHSFRAKKPYQKGPKQWSEEDLKKIQEG